MQIAYGFCDVQTCVASTLSAITGASYKLEGIARQQLCLPKNEFVRQFALMSYSTGRGHAEHVRRSRLRRQWEERRASLRAFGAEKPPGPVRTQFCPSLELGYGVRLNESERTATRAATIAAKERSMRCQCEHEKAGRRNTACAGARCLWCGGCIKCSRNLDPDVSCRCVPVDYVCQHVKNPKSMGYISR